MERYSETRPLCKRTANIKPERLRVVRSANVRPSGVITRASAFIASDEGCWRPGCAVPEGLQPDAHGALRRNADAHERHAEEMRRRDRRAA